MPLGLIRRTPNIVILDPTRLHLRRSTFQKFPRGCMPPDPPSATHHIITSFVVTHLTLLLWIPPRIDFRMSVSQYSGAHGDAKRYTDVLHIFVVPPPFPYRKSCTRPCLPTPLHHILYTQGIDTNTHQYH